MWIDGSALFMAVVNAVASAQKSAGVYPARAGLSRVRRQSGRRSTQIRLVADREIFDVVTLGHIRVRHHRRRGRGRARLPGRIREQRHLQDRLGADGARISDHRVDLGIVERIGRVGVVVVASDAQVRGRERRDERLGSGNGVAVGGWPGPVVDGPVAPFFEAERGAATEMVTGEVPAVTSALFCWRLPHAPPQIMARAAGRLASVFNRRFMSEAPSLPQGLVY